MACDLAAELHDEGNLDFYQHLVRVHHEALLFQVLSETRDAHHRGLIRTTRGRFFTDTLKRYAREWGIGPTHVHVPNPPAPHGTGESRGDP